MNKTTKDQQIDELIYALIWCSAASDFQVGGKARKGWETLCKPLLDIKAPKEEEKKTECNHWPRCDKHTQPEPKQEPKEHKCPCGKTYYRDSLDGCTCYNLSPSYVHFKGCPSVEPKQAEGWEDVWIRLYQHNQDGVMTWDALRKAEIALQAIKRSEIVAAREKALEEAKEAIRSDCCDDKDCLVCFGRSVAIKAIERLKNKNEQK